MRELKFRAWDQKRKIYGQVTMLEISDGRWYEERNFGHKGRVSLLNPANEADCGSWGSWIETVDLEQFTGLKDKNGVEIYEGDILEFDLKEWGSDTGNRFVVSWDDEGGAWDCGGGTNRECLSFKAVIGNIHENPELLK